jgi:hypothetical protein
MQGGGWGGAGGDCAVGMHSITQAQFLPDPPQDPPHEVPETPETRRQKNRPGKGGLGAGWNGENQWRTMVGFMVLPPLKTVKWRWGPVL